MGSRSIVFIFIIGILGMVAMGMLTKYTFDNNKSLQQVTEFKTELIDHFRRRGVSEVSYRKLPKKQGVVLRIVGNPAKIGEAESLHGEIGEFYLKTFSRAGNTLKLVYQPPSRFGCGNPSVFLEKDVSLQDIRALMRAREARERLERALNSRKGMRLLDLTPADGEFRVRVVWDGTKSGNPPQRVLRELANIVARRSRPSRGTRIRVQLLEAIPPSKASHDGVGVAGAPPLAEGKPQESGSSVWPTASAQGAERKGTAVKGGSPDAEAQAQGSRHRVLAERVFDNTGREVRR